MANSGSGNGEPEAGQELSLAHEVPSPAAHAQQIERSGVDQLEIEAGTGDLTGRISLGVKGDLVPAAHLFAITFCTAAAAFTAWALFHLEGVHAAITLLVVVVVVVVVCQACCTFLRRK
jgi:hypothetical protein